MRAGLSTIQQTLTSESAAVLNRSIAEAARRCHGQTTPLHVAATLLAAPTGLLRQACIRSHPASSHPLQCRALELCFTVALDRLPAVNTNSASNTSPTDPPISNALMAALKRAQAHQRRGCPEQQQQPLLAVKVELEQLIVSILDDPSVSRVMREASFSSPAVKATIEQSLSSTSSPTNSAATAGAPVITIAPKIPPRNLYMNPRLQQSTAAVASGDAAGLNEPQRVLDIMMRAKKRNPVVVADSDPAAVIREVLKRLQSGDAPPPLRAAHVITLDTEFTDRSLIPEKIRELCSSVDGWIDDGGVVLDLGDLKWLVETPGGMSGSNLIQHQQQQQQIVSETGRAAIAEITKLVQSYSDSSGGRLWIVASASCATYLRCQVYHPGMDNDWDLQALPIAPRSPVLFPRLGCSGILSSSVESLAPARGFPLLGTTGATRLRRPTEITDSPKISLCKLCMESYEQELSKLVAKKFEKSSSDSGPAPSRPLLPHWMKPTISDQIQSKPKEDEWKQSTEELLKTWQDRCSQQHQRVNPANTFPACIPLQTRLTISQTTEHAGNQLRHALNIPEQRLRMQPGSPVKTDLVLGQRDRLNEFTACKLDSLSDKQGDSFDSFKKLYKGLAERVGWQPAAATAVATVVTQCKTGRPSGLRRKNEAWLMFIGPDKVGKRKMAAALSELVFAAAPISVNLVADDGGQVGRGRTTIDRVSDAVRRNPFSVVVLEGFDRADLLVRGCIKRAIESGRMIDSQGREVSLGSVIFVLDSTWLPEELRNSHDSVLQSEEEKILESAGWQLEFSVFDRSGKRGAESGSANDRPVKKTKEFGCGAGLSLDLNLAAGVDGDAGEGSWNSSDLTFENGQESVRLGINSNKAINAANSPAAELMGLVDGAIEFKPVDFNPIRRNVLESIHAAFRTAIGNDRLIRVDDDALDIIVSGVWLTGAGVDASPFNEWAEKVLFPSMHQLMHQLKSSNLMSQGGLVIVRLSAVKDPRRRQWSSSLPSTVSIAGIGA